MRSKTAIPHKQRRYKDFHFIFIKIFYIILLKKRGKAMIEIKEIKADINNLYYLRYMEGKEKEKRRFKRKFRASQYRPTRYKEIKF